MEKRDFTEETEYEILEYCSMHEEDEDWSPADVFGTVEVERYFMNSEDISYHMKNVELHHAMYIDSQSYSEQWVHNVFNDVRTCDNNYAQKAHEYKVNAMDYYMESIQVLYESIQVTETESSTNTVGQLTGRIFGECEAFSNMVQKAGDGAITPTFQRLYENGTVNWELFDSWMQNGANGWEIVAMSKLIDTYLLDTEADTGYISTEKYSQFLNHCYIREYQEFSYDSMNFTWNSQKEISEDINNLDTYTISPMVSYLMLYRQQQAGVTLIELANKLDNVNTPRQNHKIIFDCFISDSLSAINENYQTIEKYERGRNEKLLSIAVDYGEGTATISKFNEYIDLRKLGSSPKINITLFDKSMSNGWDYIEKKIEETGKEDPDGAVYNRGIEIMNDLATKGIFKIGKSVVGNLIPEDGEAVWNLLSKMHSLRKTGMALFGLNAVKEAVEANNERIDRNIRVREYKGYVMAMARSATFFQYQDTATISNVVINDQELAMRLAYYNSVQNANLTMEELKAQFEISRNETEGIDDLISYSSFINKEGVSEGKDQTFCSCESCCYEILINNGIDPKEATLEQITDAFNEAIIVGNYMLENEYGHYRYSLQGEELIDEALAAYEEEQNGE